MTLRNIALAAAALTVVAGSAFAQDKMAPKPAPKPAGKMGKMMGDRKMVTGKMGDHKMMAGKKMMDHKMMGDHKLMTGKMSNHKMGKMMSDKKK